MSLARIYANESVTVENQSGFSLDGQPAYSTGFVVDAWVEDKLITRYENQQRKEVPGRIFIIPGDKNIQQDARITYAGKKHVAVRIERPKALGATTPDHMEITTEITA